jgi:hypothetical protein
MERVVAGGSMFWVVARGGVEPPTFRFSVGTAYDAHLAADLGKRTRWPGPLANF